MPARLPGAQLGIENSDSDLFRASIFFSAPHGHQLESSSNWLNIEIFSSSSQCDQFTDEVSINFIHTAHIGN